MPSSTELKDLILRWYEALSQNDVAFSADFFASQDIVLVIGSDPMEWWVGHERIASAMQAQMKEMNGIKFAPGDIATHVRGDFGWIADQPTLRLPDGATVPFRLTAVFAREDGTWRCVQAHLSIGVSNEQALGQKLSI